MTEKSSKRSNINPSKVTKTKKTKCATKKVTAAITNNVSYVSSTKITSLDYYYSSEDGMDEEEESEDFHFETTRSRECLEQLLTVENELAAMNQKFEEEILKIEMKSHEEKKDLVERRDEIIATIPGFWYKVMTYHHIFGVLISEDEEECLHYLSRIEIEPLGNIKKDFRIKFHFNHNPFFKNKLLIKELLFSKGCSKSSNINWRNNNNLIAIHQQNIKSAEKRGYHVSRNSLFIWFKRNLQPDQDYFAKVIKNDVLKTPLDHFFVDDDGSASYDSMDEEDLSRCIVMK